VAKLNQIVEEISNILSGEKAYNLPSVCGRYGLDEGEESEAFSSKRLYIQKRLKGKNQLFLLDLSKRIIDDYGESAKSLSKLMYSVNPKGVFEISEITRKNIFDELYKRTDLWGRADVVSFFKRIWDLDAMPSRDGRFDTAAQDIWQHMINNYDYDEQFLLEEYFELLIKNDQEFMNFLEQLVHPMIRNQSSQESYINLLNEHLHNDGFHLYPTSQLSGYPIYKVHRIQNGVRGEVKNLIFAAVGAKPEIIINDSLNNDITIVKHKDNCLVYEKPISSDGLYWAELVDWWSDMNPTLTSYKKKEVSLYKRLLNSLDSPPEITFFKAYFQLLRGQYHQNLPALIPQVYLHYDPYTKRQRNGEIYLPRQRMDFLLLLPNRERVVIEIDGKQHYSEENVASPQRYAEMVSADRDLKLHGYDVYRFGGYELMNEDKSAELMKNFFNSFFKKYAIKTTNAQ